MNRGSKFAQRTVTGATLTAAAFAAARVLAAFRPSRDEQVEELAGDNLVPEPMYATTQAVTIDTPPEQVWPWIAQMGAGRAGWYSYDHIDNGGEPSAGRILPEHQDVSAGDLFPALPGATDAFVVAAVEPPHYLVLTAPAGSHPRVSWTFVLKPWQGERTRLLVRALVSPHWLEGASDGGTTPNMLTRERRYFIEHVYRVLPQLPRPLLRIVAGFGHRLMQNRQLHGIKRRAEGRSQLLQSTASHA